MLPPSQPVNPSPTPIHPIPSSAYDQNRLLKHLSTIEKGLRARLRSIEHDSCLALTLYRSLFPPPQPPLPLFANARAGSWYVPPILNNVPSFTASFKSADGHYGQWSSSLRRPNLNVLIEALKSGGAVIVDVTRSGKRWPDSFTKTIPIWCCLINILASFVNCTCGPQQQSQQSANPPPICENCIHLHLHPSVPPSENSQILARLPYWLADWRRSSLRLPPIINQLHLDNKPLKPLRPLWLTPDSKLWQSGLPVAELDFIPIVCISASRVVPPNQRSFVEPRMEDHTLCNVDFPSFHVGFPYVQGAGDDEEAWCMGLTPELFWRHKQHFMHVADSSCDGFTHVQVEIKLRQVIDNLLHLDAEPGVPPGQLALRDHFVPIWNSRLVLVSRGATNLTAFLHAAANHTFGCMILLGNPELNRASQAVITLIAKLQEQGKLRWYKLSDKKGKTDYKYGFGRALGPALTALRECCVEKKQQALICGVDKGGDWSAGLAISWLAWHCQPSIPVSRSDISLEEAGYEIIEERKEAVDNISKEFVHGVMLHFMATFPNFQLSRATLKQINRFFSSPAPSSTVLPSSRNAP